MTFNAIASVTSRLTCLPTMPGVTFLVWTHSAPMEIIDEGLANFSPLKRLGLPENVSRVVASSARPESEWINGKSFSNKSSSFRHNSTADSFSAPRENHLLTGGSNTCNIPVSFQ